MASSTVRIRGLKELRRDFGKMSKDLQRELRLELKAAAEPVAADVRSKVARYGARTAAGIAAGTRGASAVVRQRQRKTTGLRPDFGRLQMGLMVESLDEKQPETIRGLERMLDRLAGHNGF